MKRALLVLLALAAPAAAQSPPTPGGLFERDVVDIAAAKGIAIREVTVDNRLGDVKVEGHDGSGVQILAIKRAPDEETLDRLKVSLVPDPSGAIRIDTSIAMGPEARPIASGSIRIDLVIRAPRGARVQAAVWNGKLELTKMDAGAELTANEGDIDVRSASGPITTHSAHGDQRFAEVYGAIDAEGVIGDMALEVVRGDRLAAKVHDGNIVGRKVRSREVLIRTTIGDITFSGEVIAGGSYKISSYRGNVEVAVGGAPFRVRAASRKGRVDGPAELTRNAAGQLLGFYGKGRRPALVEVTSRLGNIKFGLLEEQEN